MSIANLRKENYYITRANTPSINISYVGTQLVPNNTLRQIGIGMTVTTNWNIGDMTVVSGGITIATSGKYRVTGNISYQTFFDGSSGACNELVAIGRNNGADILCLTNNPYYSSGVPDISQVTRQIVGNLQLNAGDNIYMLMKTDVPWTTISYEGESNFNYPINLTVEYISA